MKAKYDSWKKKINGLLGRKLTKSPLKVKKMYINGKILRKYYIYRRPRWEAQNPVKKNLRKWEQRIEGRKFWKKQHSVFQSFMKDTCF